MLDTPMGQCDNFQSAGTRVLRVSRDLIQSEGWNVEPATLTTLIWADIGKFLTNMWLFVFLVIVFATSMLIGHNAIPSLVSSGHVPESMRKLRLPIYVVALVALLGALSFLYIGFGHGLDAIRQIYPHYWI